MQLTLALLFLLAKTFTSYAPTPQEAAIQTVHWPGNAHVVVNRANVVGRYATVLTGGGTMEGYLVREPILLEHFSFGWEALDLLNDRCNLEQHAIKARDAKLLMRGMPKPRDNRSCRDNMKDVGPRAAIEAVRRQMLGPLVPYVVVSGNYAMGQWYGLGGGESLYRKIGGEWQGIAGGGGAMGVQEMRKYGVPQAAWRAFGIYNAKCKRKS